MKNIIWFLPLFALFVFALQNVTAPVGTAASAILGMLSALFWIISTYAPERESRILNAAAGGYTGTGVIFSTVSLLGAPLWWPWLTGILGAMFFLITVLTSICASFATESPFRVGKSN